MVRIIIVIPSFSADPNSSEFCHLIVLSLNGASTVLINIINNYINYFEII